MTGSFNAQRRRLVGAGLTALVAPALGKAAAQATPFKNIDAFVADAMRRANIPGLALGLASNGIVRFVQGYGLADIASRRPVGTNTMFHIASITKTVTATAILQLAERGKLNLDAPVTGYLDFPLRNPHHPDVPITFRQLLMHTSSLSDVKYYDVDFREHGRDATLPLANFLKDYLTPDGRLYSAETCFSHEVPGTTWDYSNVGYGLLGYLAGRIGDLDMREQTHERIFKPLGMRHTSWTISGTPAPLRATPYDDVEGALAPIDPVGFPDWAAGMLRSSIADFTRFVAASANEGVAGRTRLVGTTSMQTMLGMQTPAKLPDWLTGQGLGWMASNLDGKPTPNHWGGDPGVFTAVYLDPAHRSGVAIFTNSNASAERRNAVKSIASRLLDSQR
jgi:CubicO group peptidase (beta-lactamase class C family)